tara:strand:- start:241 stop:915 length:675 start_codon:yes stop_codon:yes gene_type:complete
MLDYILKKINNTKICENPYKHIIIDNFIPPAAYKLLAKELDDINLKESDNNENVEVYKEQGGAVGDRIISFVKNENKFPNWFAINEFTSSWIKNQDKIFKALKDKFKIEGEYDYLDFCVIKDETSYKIQPHTDQPHNFFTLLFYCPTTTKNKELGLSIFEEGSGDVYLTRDGEHRTLKEVKKAEFLPNRLICFKRTENSWHSVGHEDNILKGSRNSCQIFFMNH